MNFLSRFEKIKALENISSADSSLFKKIIGDYYQREIVDVDRSSDKKGFFSNSWKVVFKSSTAFMKLSSGGAARNMVEHKKWLGWKLLFQQILFEQGVFKSNKKGIAPFWLTKNKKSALFIEMPMSLSLVVILTGYFKKRKSISWKRDMPIIGQLLTELHSKGRELWPKISKLNFAALVDYHRNPNAKEKFIKEEITLLHGDLTFDNIIVDSKNNVWFLDWDCLGIGYPEYDLAYFVKNLRDLNKDKEGAISKLFLEEYQKNSDRKINFSRLNKYLKLFDKNQSFVELK